MNRERTYTIDGENGETKGLRYHIKYNIMRVCYMVMMMTSLNISILLCCRFPCMACSFFWLGWVVCVSEAIIQGNNNTSNFWVNQNASEKMYYEI